MDLDYCKEAIGRGLELFRGQLRDFVVSCLQGHYQEKWQECALSPPSRDTMVGDRLDDAEKNAGSVGYRYALWNYARPLD